MPRLKLLQTVDVQLVATPAPAPVVEPAAPAAPVVKPDPVIEFAGADADGRFSFVVPAYDTATHAHLTALHVSLYEKPAGGGPAAVPADPTEIVKAALHYSVGASTPVSSGTAVPAQTLVVDGTASPEGTYSAALVAEFAE